MAWYAVFDDTTGELVSLTTIVDPAALPAGMAFAPLAEKPDPSEVVWDKATRSFVPRPVTKAELEGRLQPPYEVWLRWKMTLAEATARSYPAAVITALTTRTNAAWTDYAAAIEAWRNA